MLDGLEIAALKAALEGLQAGDAAGWKALEPLASLAVMGTDVSIDFSTVPALGAPVIIATRSASAPVPGGLTARQRMVAEAMVRGWSNKAIARLLGISPLTVRDHARAVLAAAGVRNRTELLAGRHAVQSAGRQAERPSTQGGMAATSPS